MSAKRCLALGLLSLPIVQASSGDDFSNNFATDIAPLLALFGEQVAKDFLAGSLSWTDDIIFAMGALGVITAMVGAIRVGGPVWLKAVIGRARESRGDVEVELLSSTSKDVCEAWNGQAVVRLVGTPSIVELILSDDPKDETAIDSCHGIRGFWEALEDRVVVENRDGVAVSPKQTDPEERLLDEFPPNITLSVNGGGANKYELRAVAVFGVFAQLSVLCLAGVETYVPAWKPRFKKDGEEVGPYSFPLMVIGTSLLVLGMIMCAHIIESSSNKGQWSPAQGLRRVVKLAWLQRGGRIGDQEFNSFAIFSRGGVRLRKSTRNPHHGKETQVVLATATTLVGFVSQFSALRFLHWSVTICQLVAIGIMTALRAWIRRHVAYPPERVEEIPQGYELDWMSRHLRKCKSWEILPLNDVSPAASSSPPVPGPNGNLATAVFNARKRLQLISNWTGPYYETAEALSIAIETLLNMSMLSNVGTLRDKGELHWMVPVNVRQTGSETSDTSNIENITVRLSRNFEHGRWSPWRVEKADIVALLGLWTADYHEKAANAGTIPNIEDQTARRSMRILGHLGDDDEFRLWMPASTEYHAPGDNLQEELLDLDIASTRVFPKLTSPISGMIGVVVEATPYAVMVQMLFSLFLSQIAQHLEPFTDMTARPRGGKNKFNSYGLHSQTVDKIVDELVHLHIATEDAAYASVVPALFSRGLLPKLSESRSVASIARDIKRMELADLDDEAEYAFLWIQHRVDAIAATTPWRDVAEVYGQFAAVCERIFGEHHNWTVEAQDRFSSFSAARRRLADDENLKDITHAITATRYSNLAVHELVMNKKLQDIDSQRADLYKLRDLETFFDDITALLIAIDAKLFGIAQLLLSRDPASLLRAVHGHTALARAIASKDARMLRMVSFYDADDVGVDVSFLEAAKAGKDDLAGTMLNAGANIAVKDAEGHTALHLAASNNDYNALATLLIDGGIDMTIKDNRNESALDIAVSKGHDAVADILLRKGADPSSRDRHGRPQLLNALSASENAPMVKLLLKHGADVVATDGPGWTALHRAAANGYMEAAQLLIENGASISAQDAHRWTPLHAASLAGHTDLVGLLLCNKADANVADGYRSTPLHGAASCGWEAVVMKLLTNGSKVNAKDGDGWTPLHRAAFAGYESVVDMLLQKGANVNERDNTGSTALHCGAAGGFADLTTLLLRNGAHKGAENYKGETALDVALAEGHKSVVRILQSKEMPAKGTK